MIKNIVFDFGNVLVDFDVKRIAETFGTAEEDVELILRRVFQTSTWTALDRGVITFDEAEKAMCGKLPERLHGIVHNILFHWSDYAMFPMPGMAELVRELKELGYGIYLLSNATVQQAEYFHRVPGNEYFDGRITSGEWKYLKPEHELYEALFDTYKLNPDECIFIDDVPGNIEAGERVGMRGIVFFKNNMSYLREELITAGVPVKP